METLRGTLTDAARAGWAIAPPAVDGGSPGTGRDETPATLIATMDGALTDATPTAEARLERLGSTSRPATPSCTRCWPSWRQT